MTIFVFIKCCKQSSSQDAIQWKVMQAEKDITMLYLFFINKLRPSTLGMHIAASTFPISSSFFLKISHRQNKVKLNLMT